MKMITPVTRAILLITLSCMGMNLTTACKLKKLRGKAKRDAEQMAQPHVAEGAEMNLSTEPLRNSNLIEESGGDRVTSFYKLYTFRNGQEFRGTFSEENLDYSNCANTLGVETAVRLLSTEGVVDLKRQAIVVVRANVAYSIEVKLANLGKCQNLSYRFGMNFSPNAGTPPPPPPPVQTPVPQPTVAPPPPPPARLTEPVACDWVDSANFFGKITFNPADNKILMSNGTSNVGVEFFGAKTACGYKPTNNNNVKCDPASQFNGDVFSRSLGCSAVAPFGGESPISSGSFTFSLRNGQGRLSCNVFSSNRANLTLKNCRIAAALIDFDEI